MTNTKKEVSVPSKINSFEDAAKGLKELERKVNELFHNINTKNPNDDKNIKSGATRISKLSNEEHRLEFKTDDGWKSLYLRDDEVKLGETETEKRREKVEAIDQLESIDINAKNDITKKTIINPDTGRYDVNHLINFPRADFITPWLPLSTNNATITIEGNIGHALISGGAGTTTIKHPDIYHGLGTRLLFPYIVGRWLDSNTPAEYRYLPLLAGNNNTYWPQHNSNDADMKRLGIGAYFWHDDAIEIAIGDDGIIPFDNFLYASSVQLPDETWTGDHGLLGGSNGNSQNNGDYINYIFYELEFKLFLWKLNLNEFYNPDKP